MFIGRDPYNARSKTGTGKTLAFLVPTVEKIFKNGEPKVLNDRFPSPIRGDVVTRAIKRGELCEPPGYGLDEKSFGVWAPRVYNESLRRKQ